MISNFTPDEQKTYNKMLKNKSYSLGINVMDLFNRRDKCCDNCKHYNWYYDLCNLYKCEIDFRALCCNWEEQNNDCKRVDTNTKNDAARFTCL